MTVTRCFVGKKRSYELHPDKWEYIHGGIPLPEFISNIHGCSRTEARKLIEAGAIKFQSYDNEYIVAIKSITSRITLMKPSDDNPYYFLFIFEREIKENYKNLNILFLYSMEPKNFQKEKEFLERKSKEELIEFIGMLQPL